MTGTISGSSAEGTEFDWVHTAGEYPWNSVPGANGPLIVTRQGDPAAYSGTGPHYSSRTVQEGRWNLTSPIPTPASLGRDLARPTEPAWYPSSWVPGVMGSTGLEPVPSQPPGKRHRVIAAHSTRLHLSHSSRGLGSRHRCDEMSRPFTLAMDPSQVHTAFGPRKSPMLRPKPDSTCCMSPTIGTQRPRPRPSAIADSEPGPNGGRARARLATGPVSPRQARAGRDREPLQPDSRWDAPALDLSGHSRPSQVDGSLCLRLDCSTTPGSRTLGPGFRLPCSTRRPGGRAGDDFGLRPSRSRPGLRNLGSACSRVRIVR